MSKLKKKNPLRKRKNKFMAISLRQAAEQQLQISRNKIKEEDDNIIEDLIEKKLLKENGNYRHVQNVARDLEWSTSRVFRSIERIANYKRVQETIKKRIQEQAKQFEAKEKEDAIKD